MATFVNELKKLAEHCGDKLNENLRDLAEDKPDYKKVYDLALTLEAAEKGVKELRETSSQGNSHKVHKIDRGGSKEKSEGGAVACYRCGGKNHSQAYCYHRHAVCHNCGKKGHIGGRACRSKGKPQQHRDNPQPQQRGKKSTNRNYRLEDERPCLPYLQTFQIRSTLFTQLKQKKPSQLRS